MSFKKANKTEEERDFTISTKITQPMAERIKDIIEEQGVFASDWVFNSLVASLNRTKDKDQVRCKYTMEFDIVIDGE